MLARRRFPGGQNNLDDLCKRFGIDNSRRTKHGALLDAELLAEVYLELIGARQTTLGLSQSETSGGVAVRAMLSAAAAAADRRYDAMRNAPRIVAFVATLGAAAIWRDYIVLPGDEVAQANR